MTDEPHVMPGYLLLRVGGHADLDKVLDARGHVVHGGVAELGALRGVWGLREETKNGLVFVRLCHTALS